jgi:hypothetical protein
VTEFVEQTSSSSSDGGKLCCDKCDGRHATDCPYYKKKRDDHPDGNAHSYPPPAFALVHASHRTLSFAAWRHVGRKPKDMGSNGGNVIVSSARVVRQPAACFTPCPMVSAVAPPPLRSSVCLPVCVRIRRESRDSICSCARSLHRLCLSIQTLGLRMTR